VSADSPFRDTGRAAESESKVSFEVALSLRIAIPYLPPATLRPMYVARPEKQKGAQSMLYRKSTNSSLPELHPLLPFITISNKSGFGPRWTAIFGSAAGQPSAVTAGMPRLSAVLLARLTGLASEPQNRLPPASRSVIF